MTLYEITALISVRLNMIVSRIGASVQVVSYDGCRVLVERKEIERG